jgi:hypothetical protein
MAKNGKPRTTYIGKEESTMAWEVYLSPEGWQAIYDELQTWSAAKLREAIVEADVAKFVANSDIKYAADDREVQLYEEERILYWNDVPHESLVDVVYKQIEETNTCDNGGNGYWIDGNGGFKVNLR